MRRVIVYLLAASVVISCAYYRFVYYRQTDKNAIPVDEEIFNVSDFMLSGSYDYDGKQEQLPQDLKKQADSISEKYKSVAVQVAVVENCELKYTYEYGYADTEKKLNVVPDTKFRIASLSKFVTDAVFMKLCEIGKAAINADISDYLGYKVRNPYYPEKVITPAMLVAHTSTIVNSEQFDYSLMNRSVTPIQEILSYDSAFCMAEPGNYYCYSNFAVAILGAICEKLTSIPFNNLAELYFFDPLDIDASYLAFELENRDLLANIYAWEGLTVQEQLNVRSHQTIGQTHHLVQGNLTVSAKDYAKFIAMICAGGLTENGERLISQESIDEMLKSRIYSEGLGSGFGVEENKLLIKDRTLYSHTGNSYGLYSTFTFDKESRDAVIIITSGTNAEYLDAYGMYDICVELTKLFLPTE